MVRGGGTTFRREAERIFFCIERGFDATLYIRMGEAAKIGAGNLGTYRIPSETCISSNDDNDLRHADFQHLDGPYCAVSNHD